MIKEKNSAVDKKQNAKMLKQAKSILEKKTIGLVLVTEVVKKDSELNILAMINKMNRREVNESLEGFKRENGIRTGKSLSEMIVEAKAETDEISKIINIGANYCRKARRYSNKALLFYILTIASFITFVLLDPSKWFAIGIFIFFFIGFEYSDKAKSFLGKSEGINEITDIILNNKVKNLFK